MNGQGVVVKGDLRKYFVFARIISVPALIVGGVRDGDLVEGCHWYKTGLAMMHDS